jgi:hypothetical protein
LPTRVTPIDAVEEWNVDNVVGLVDLSDTIITVIEKVLELFLLFSSAQPRFWQFLVCT